MNAPERKKKNAFALRSIPAQPGASTVTKFYCNVCERYDSKSHVGLDNQLELDLQDKKFIAIRVYRYNEKKELTVRIRNLPADYTYALAK